MKLNFEEKNCVINSSFGITNKECWRADNPQFIIIARLAGERTLRQSSNFLTKSISPLLRSWEFSAVQTEKQVDLDCPQKPTIILGSVFFLCVFL